MEKIETSKSKISYDTLQTYIDLAEVMLLALDVNGMITLINRKGCEIMGYQESELLGRNWFSTCLPSNIATQTYKVFKEIISDVITPIEYYENPVKTNSGEIRTIAFHNTPTRDEKGNIIGVLVSGSDVTEHLLSQQALQNSENHYKAMFNHSGTAFAIIEESLLISQINKRFEELSGYVEDEIVNRMKITDFIDTGRTEAEIQEALHQPLELGSFQQFEFDFRNKSGVTYSLMVELAGIPDTTKMIASILDISLLKKAEEKLQKHS